MAFAIKYKAFFKSVDGSVKQISLLKDGYVGDAVEWICSAGSVSYSTGDMDSIFPDNPIVVTTATMRFIFEEAYDLTEFALEQKTFRLEVYNLDTELTEFTGWVEPWNAQVPFSNPPYMASLSASCGLGHLTKTRFSFSGNESALTGIEVIIECLKKIGLGIGLITSVHIKNNRTALGADTFKTFKVDTNRYFDSNGDRLYCDEVLRDLLEKFNCEVFQHKNKWMIRSIPDHARGVFVSYYEYDVNGEQIATGTIAPIDYLINDDDDAALTLSGSTAMLRPLVNKYRVSVDLGPKKTVISNGNMLQWNTGGLYGWDFSRMPKSTSNGWSQEPTSNVQYPYALKVTGIGPEINQKYKKHWWSLHRSTRRVEPTEYIETPISEFQNTNDKVTVSFEYRTGDNVFVFAINITSSTNPAKNKWINSKGEAYDEWTYIESFYAQGSRGWEDRPPEKFELNIDMSTLNAVSGRLGDDEITREYTPYDTISIRFYKSYQNEGDTGNFYMLYNVQAVVGEVRSVGKESSYTSTLSYESDTETQAKDISLITSDYSGFYTGALLGLNGAIGEGADWSWSRPGKTEAFSLYRSLMIDRLSMTIEPMKIVEGEVFVNEGSVGFGYLNTLIFADFPTTRFRIVRFDYDDHKRRARVTAVQVREGDLDEGKLLQEGIVDNVKQYDSTGNADGVYPVRGGGNKSVTDQTDEARMNREELDDQLDANARIPTLFEFIDRQEFIVAIENNVSVDLEDYINAIFIESEHEISELTLTIEQKPAWVDVLITGLVVELSGTPMVLGVYGVVLRVTDEEEYTNQLITIEIEVVPESVYVSELLTAGQYVYLFMDGTTVKCGLADASDPLKAAVGFVTEDYLIGELAVIQTSSQQNNFVTGIEPGKYYFLSDIVPGGILDERPTEVGHIVQSLGYGTGDSELVSEIIQARKLWTPPFVDIPEIRFVVGSEITAELDLNEYVADYTDDEDTYQYRLLQLPHWVSEKSVVFNNVSVTGTADLPGLYEFLLEIKNLAGEVFLQPINIIVEEKPVVEIALIDTDASSEVGIIPDTSLPSLVMPDNWNAAIHIVGTHNRVWAKVTLPGGGTYEWTTPYVSVALTPEDTYDLFPAPVSYGPGLFKIEFKAWYGDTLIHDSARQFFLTDSTLITGDLTVELWDINADPAVEISPITPTGSTPIIKPIAWDLKIVVADTEHDNVTGKLIYEGGEVNKSFDQDPPVFDAEYDFWGVDAGFQAGNYTLIVTVSLDSVVVLSNAFAFELMAPETVNSYSVNVGDGVNTEYTFTHNLGTYDLTDSVIELATKERVYTTITYPTENTVYLKFTTAPTSNKFRLNLQREF